MIINFIKNREKKYFKKQFEKRFKIIPNISNERSSSEFFSILIDEIEKQYQNEIKRSDNSIRYIEIEKIRLRAKIELLKSQDFDISFKYLSAFYSIVIPIMASAIGFIFISTKSIVDFALQNKTDQIKNVDNITPNEAYDFLAGIYNDFNFGNVQYIGQILTGGIFILGIFFSYMIIQENKRKENNSKNVSFESMCLDILENIKI